MKYLLFILLSVLLIFSCKKDTEEDNTPVVSKDYFPTSVGKELVYDIVEINIDKAVDVNDTIKYQLKELFESKYTDDAGNTNYRIERYYKNEIDTVWKVLNIWYVSIVRNAVFKTEENYRYKRLIFPIKVGNTWDGNIENTKETEEYEITEVDFKQTIGDVEYSNVLVVLQNDNENLIEKQYAIEEYVKNVGLAYKEIIDISELEPQPGINWEQRINVGYIYKQTLK